MAHDTSQPLILLGHDVIDRDHGAFAALVAKLQCCSAVDFPTLFGELLEHTDEHFARENALMTESAFPALREHKGEHERVLGEFRQFKERVDRGFLPFGRSFVIERLVPWFALHITTMDSALVAHIQKPANR